MVVEEEQSVHLSILLLTLRFSQTFKQMSLIHLDTRHSHRLLLYKCPVLQVLSKFWGLPSSESVLSWFFLNLGWFLLPWLITCSTCHHLQNYMSGPLAPNGSMQWCLHPFKQTWKLGSRNSGLSLSKDMLQASLVAQWLRIRLPMQGTWVQSLVREDPTCRGAAKPVCHNY